MGTFPKTVDTIKADMLFNKNRFRLPGSRTWYTATREPSIEGPKGKEKVFIQCVGPTGAHKTLRVPYGSNVIINTP